MRRVVIVRHGNTFEAGEPSLRIGAPTDLPLTETGRDQARAIGKALSGRIFDRVVASALLRVSETALIIGESIRAPRAEIHDWAAEIDHGPDEGRPDREVIARVGQPAIDAWDAHATPPSEWRVDAAKRTAAWWRFLTGTHGDALVVTSSGAARFALVAIGARPVRGMKMRTGAWGEIVVDSSNTPRLDCWDIRPGDDQ